MGTYQALIEPADVHLPRQVGQQVVDPRAGGDHGGVEALAAGVGADLHAAAGAGLISRTGV